MVANHMLLQELGLNRLEADVYLLLLAEPEPVTAYRIGKTLGKPTANVYKAIEALLRKGAVVVEEGDRRVCRAVAPAEFLEHLERTFVWQTRAAKTRLRQQRPRLADERIYQLESVPLVFERCRAMLARSERIAVVDAFPHALEEIRPAVAETAERGVAVYLLAYAPVSVAGAQVALAFQRERILRHWNSQQLHCVIDGRETLVTLLNNELSAVHQALWTRSLFLSCFMHAGLLREHVFHEIAAVLDGGDSSPRLRELVNRHPSFHSVEVPGQRELFDTLGVSGGDQP
ncbi:MAG: hypothetical protein KKB50_03665 [Planctomycetes bacterium]|nr:hypothetical protein [Planctomycetota bacterium]